MTTPPTAVHHKGFLSLPDELLDPIFELAVSGMHDHEMYGGRHLTHNHKYRDGIALLAVCRRFRRVITPFLYRAFSINLGGDNLFYPTKIRTSNAVTKLISCLQDNRSLGQYCHKLELRAVLDGVPRKSELGLEENTGVSSTSYHVQTAISLVNSLPNTKFFSFQVSDSEPDLFWPVLFAAAKSMTGLETLHLYMNAGLHLVPVCQMLDDMPNLKALELSNVAPTYPRFPSSVMKTYLRTSSITSITLSGKLEQFSFQSWYHHVNWSGRRQAFDLTVMHVLLSHHKSTLRSIKISILSGAFGSFDVTDFPLLEELSISRWNTMVRWSDEDKWNGNNVAANNTYLKLLAPRLRKLCWHWTGVDQQCSESIEDFDQNDEDWLRGLVLAAVDRKIPLENIRVDFNPDSGFFSRRLCQVKVYPYDRIDRVAAEIKSTGIAIEYPTPWISKGYFEVGSPPRESSSPTPRI
ncbi:hypothetical protein QBC40DRAFT_267099 [Triangularia verruculosa]|uniref:F-box domain-containing protein n=1 Tax=Triangularia verruculosa TaxID=2587418 RepID=A0AAN7AR60_9PEZI|nr:hypothetical protein QBC40DRAFT_267099 [Triangularia verruculosa]